MRSGRYHLRKICTLLLLFMVWIVTATGCATPTASPPPEEAVKEKPEIVPHVLKDIRVTDKKILLKFMRSGSRSINYTGFKLIDPLRLVVDLFGTVADGLPSPMAIEDEIISKVEIIEFVHESQPITRVEIGFNRDTAYFTDQAQDEIWVIFFADPQLVGTAEAQGEPIVHPEVEEPLPEIKTKQAAETPLLLEEEPVTPAQPIAEEPVAPARKILEIQQKASGEDLDVYITGNGRFDNYNTLFLPDPPRLVLDLFGVRSTEVKGPLILDGHWVRRIRLGLHSNKVRVVFDLIHAPQAEVPYHITLGNDRLVVSFKPGSGFPAQ
jgi:type IV pilus assembly protein PilQ